eukprot:NODE_1869_length_2350_cov_6.551057.p1 GENE.NODE_1869_length_2350_cov_6.551057~~NODE_1869_length_2350_cov_6.551057.p1  ORF type:complete len:746 (+),score=227.33 NODE_1869_length_2350_cov_6.551057:148-2238(+)
MEEPTAGSGCGAETLASAAAEGRDRLEGRGGGGGGSVGDGDRGAGGIGDGSCEDVRKGCSRAGRGETPTATDALGRSHGGSCGGRGGAPRTAPAVVATPPPTVPTAVPPSVASSLPDCIGEHDEVEAPPRSLRERLAHRAGGGGGDAPAFSPMSPPSVRTAAPSTPRLRPLRERLARRASLPGIRPPDVADDDAPDGIAKAELTPRRAASLGSLPREHSALGGLSLRWRLLLHTGSAARQGDTSPKPARGKAASPEKTAAASPTVATSCRRSSCSALPALSAPTEAAGPGACGHGGGGSDECGSSPSGSRAHGRGNARPAPTPTDDDVTFRVQGHEMSIGELKAMIAGYGLEQGDCVEKAELIALWNIFQDLRAKPLVQLRAQCVAAGATPLSIFPGDATACARFLLNTSRGSALPRQASRSPAAPPHCAARPSSDKLPSAGRLPSPCAAPARAWSVSASGGGCGSYGGGGGGAEAADQLRDPAATAEVARILSLRRGAFRTSDAWAVAVLGAEACELRAVQRAHRLLMKRLHPDRVGTTGDAARALEVARDARECCERGLSRQLPPDPPQCLAAVMLSMAPGRRRLRVNWRPPAACEAAPVRRYVVSAFDPSYGRALTVATLEPDYSEELRRFVPVEELTSCELLEQELVKMPWLFRQPILTLQVAAANDAGRSSWATLRVPLAVRVAVQMGSGL